MLGNYQNLQMDMSMSPYVLQNFTSLLFPPPPTPAHHQQFSPTLPTMQNNSISSQFSSPVINGHVNNTMTGTDLGALKLGTMMETQQILASPPVAPQNWTPSSNFFQPSSLSIPDFVTNTSGFNFLPQHPSPFLTPPHSLGSLMNLASPTGWPTSTSQNMVADQQAQALSNLLKAVLPNSLDSRVTRPVDMPVLSPLLPGISTSFPNFATLPLVQQTESQKAPETSLIPTRSQDYPIPSPPVLESQIPQDPTTTATVSTSSLTTCEMPSSSISISQPSFEMPMFHSILDFQPESEPAEKQLEEAPQILDKSMEIVEFTEPLSAPNSPPVLTRIEEPVARLDDLNPNPPELRAEVINEQEPMKNGEEEEEIENRTDKTDEFEPLPIEPPQLYSEENVDPSVAFTIPSAENSHITLENSPTTVSEDTLNHTESSTDSTAQEPSSSRVNIDEEPLLDSLEVVSQYSGELNLSEADWIEIMTESRRRRLRPSTQANTVATLQKITSSSHKNGKVGRKHRSYGSSERDVPNGKIAKMGKEFHENESENQAPSTSDLYSSPISIDVNFCKTSHDARTPSSSGVSTASNLSESSSKEPTSKSSWKVLRRSKNGNTLWLGSNANSQEDSEDQKENVCLAKISEEGSAKQSQKGKRRHTISVRRPGKKPIRIKSNWMPVGKPIEKFVRTNNDAYPILQECYTAIKHRYETDEVIKARDCIKVRSAEGLENVGKVLNFYIDEGGHLMANVLWYYTREQIEVVKNQENLAPLHEKELLASRHIDNIACDAIESIAFVLTFNEYCRYITEGQIDSLPVCLRPLESQELWPRGEEDYPRRPMLPHEDSPGEVVYFSRRVYDIKMKRVYVPKPTTSITLRSSKSAINRPIRASSH